ncbi:MAG: hypothetical protein IPP48_12640 [Chitinophagaceae bacterium]|nr:hypothetical protein [Chitinophagaceae bacterium]
MYTSNADTNLYKRLGFTGSHPVIAFGNKHIKPLFKNTLGIAIILISIIVVSLLQWYVQRHLPLRDCLPYKVGNNILDLRKMPKDAVPDKYDYTFVYQKNGEKKEFTTSALPDSTWQFVDRKQVLIQKGKNNVPLINDFSFTTQSGNDTTEAVLTQQGEYYLLFVKDFVNYPSNWNRDLSLVNELALKKPLYIITSNYDLTNKRFNFQEGSGLKKNLIPIFTCDATAIKTAARSNPTLYLMNGAVVKHKWGWADFDNVLK